MNETARTRMNERSRQWRLANPGAMAAHGRRELATLQQAVFGHYGWSCACCGATEALTIDHITPGEPYMVGVQLYRWLVANGLPDGFQTLCLSCNASKGNGERCRIDHRPACTHCGGSGKEPATKLRARVLAGSNGHDPQNPNGDDADD